MSGVTLHKKQAQLKLQGKKDGELLELEQALTNITESFLVTLDEKKPVAFRQADLTFASGPGTGENLGLLPALTPEQLGDSDFCRDHGIRYAYVGGAMANGIASAEMVEALAKVGCLAVFGSAGLAPDLVEQNLIRLKKNIGHLPFGSNLIHSPNEPALEQRIVDLYIKHEIRLISASAYLRLTLPLVEYRVHGIHRNQAGEIVTPNRILAKVSRIEVANQFFSPPPQKMLDQLVQQGKITAEQAEMASTIPMAQDLTAEADSGGHTDNRPALGLFPTMIALKNRMQKQFGYKQALRVGAAGGIANPESAAACFHMGAAYIVTGSVNQSCLESGSSDVVRGMLAKAKQADVTMAPAADMFEMGVQVQVLKFGTMFAVKGKKLYEYYRKYASIEEMPPEVVASLEKDYFKRSVNEEWESTKSFFAVADPRQVERANKDPRHKMALLFRSYLGQSSRWANRGVPDRRVDYQIWCGPAMGAFNEWVLGTFLEEAKNRTVALVAYNILYGACYQQRAQMLQAQGLKLDAQQIAVAPQTWESLQKYFTQQ